MWIYLAEETSGTLKKNYIKWHIVKILKSVNQRNRFKPLRHVEHVTLELEGKLEHVHLELEGKLKHVPLKLEGKLEHAPLKLEGKIKLQQSLSGVCCNVILIHLLKMWNKCVGVVKKFIYLCL